MSILSSRKLAKIEKKCNQILKNDNIKFVGVINSLGNLIAGGFKKDTTMIGTENLQKMMYMQLKLDLDMRKDYDELYGPVSYVLSKRRHAEKFTIPIGNYMVLLITGPNFDHAKLEEVISVFNSIMKN
ncbi:MAG: hypothetical protein OER82_09915 [Nitrosopumilus sp.]|nr:hypothetical protein [Nitrosopumilus sp.]